MEDGGQIKKSVTHSSIIMHAWPWHCSFNFWYHRVQNNFWAVVDHVLRPNKVYLSYIKFLTGQTIDTSHEHSCIQRVVTKALKSVTVVIAKHINASFLTAGSLRTIKTQLSVIRNCSQNVWVRFRLLRTLTNNNCEWENFACSWHVGKRCEVAMQSSL